MRRTALLGAAASLCLVIGAAGCGGGKGDSKADITADLSKKLQNGGDGFDEDTADCFAEIVVEEVGAENVKDFDLSASEPPEEFRTEIAAATVRAADECNLSGLDG